MRVLITGVTGFVGRHFVQFLSRKQGIELFGIGRSRKKIAASGLAKKIKFYEIDLRDASKVKKVLGQIKPARLFHLAAQSSSQDSWNNPAKTLANNIECQLNIFEAVKELAIHPLIHIAGSSQVYGVGGHGRPIGEETRFTPLSPYGVSKVAQDLLAYQYYRHWGLRTVRTRAFNHTGPGQDPSYIVSNFARQIAWIESGKQEPALRVGNLKLTRDFTDVRDIVQAYWLALEKGEPGEVYNIGSGHGVRLSEIAQAYIRLCRVPVKIKKESTRLRQSDAPKIIGDASKFRKKTGWKPQIALEETLLDVLNYWRENVGLKRFSK